MYFIYTNFQLSNFHQSVVQNYKVLCAHWGQSLGRVHKKDPYREGPVLLIRVLLMYVGGA